MNRSRILFLLLSITGWLLSGCASEYRSLTPVAADAACISRFVPRSSTTWYHAGIDVAGKHLSGLLITKVMPDSSNRIVFTSEAGVTFFDFEFDRNQEFKVHSIIKKMNRKPVVTTLRKDFSLLLGIPFRNGNIKAWSSEGLRYYGVAQKKETVYFVTDAECSTLQRLELGSSRKRKVTLGHAGADTVTIVHHLFPMQIQLLRFQKQ